MSKQAKTLTAVEFRRVLDYVATRKHAERNRGMLMLMYYAGLRVGETANLRIEDVVDADGLVRHEIFLKAEQTKGGYARTLFVSDKLHKELVRYIAVRDYKHTKEKLFYSQKQNSDGFSANSLTQFFHYLYKNANIAGASSHSCRRTFITNLATKGVSVRVLMNLAGHKNISTTQAYIDINDDMLRKAVELM
jgi:integrase/recombinase XerD